MCFVVVILCLYMFYEGWWWLYEFYVCEVNWWGVIFEEFYIVVLVDFGFLVFFLVLYVEYVKVELLFFCCDCGYGVDQV